MTHDDDIREAECGTVRELVVWYPTRALDANERRLVEEHSARCAACTALLRFAAEVKAIVVEKSALHTDPALLVAFAEGAADLGAAEREAVKRHLAACMECREQVDMLREVERATVGEKAEALAEERARATARLEDGSSAELGAGGWRGFWDLLAGTLFRPVPAAIYMVLAIVATVLLVGEPGEWGPDYDGRPGTGAIFPGKLGGVVILGDEAGRVRASGDRGGEEITLDRGESHFLTLELTGLGAPPEAGDTYTVEFIDERTGERSYATAVRGDAFQENYTLGMLLEREAMPAGRYVVRVLDPRGEIVFSSSFALR